jgi:hypothetical protein
MFLRIQVAVAILVAPSAVALATDSSVTAPLDAPFQRASYKTVVQPPAPGKIGVFSRITPASSLGLSVEAPNVDPANLSCPCIPPPPSKVLSPPPAAFTPENRSSDPVIPLHLPAP